MPTLDLFSDPVHLTAALVDIPSVSLDETRIADAVEQALREQAPGFEIIRSGNSVLARTNLGLPSRVMLAGHLDTVPIADNVPSHRTDGILHGCGTVDMKSGDAVFLHLAVSINNLAHDLTLIMYDAEEIAAEFNGLGRIEREHREWLDADLAILGEPTDGLIEAGCQGTMRAEITARGRRAHSARSWLGDNAIHKIGAALERLSAYQARIVDIDGCEYREGLSAVRIDGGVAGNVIPDHTVLHVNFRFAPDRDQAQAEAHIREVFDGLPLEVTITDSAPGALPGLSAPAAAALVTAAGGVVRAKFGWTDVSRFAALGIPAVNFGPGDPNLAHTREEHVRTAQITEVADVLRNFLSRD